MNHSFVAYYIDTAKTSIGLYINPTREELSSWATNDFRICTGLCETVSEDTPINIQDNNDICVNDICCAQQGNRTFRVKITSIQLI